MIVKKDIGLDVFASLLYPYRMLWGHANTGVPLSLDHYIEE